MNDATQTEDPTGSATVMPADGETTKPAQTPADPPPDLDRVIDDLAEQGSKPRSEAQASPAMAAFLDIPVQLDVVLTAMTLPVSDLMALQPGRELDLLRNAGAPVSLVVNGRTIGTAELFLLDRATKRVGARITGLAGTEPATERP